MVSVAAAVHVRVMTVMTIVVVLADLELTFKNSF
jgi:hypothetical protein